MATIKDVAQAAQVSTAAVSRVLNKDDNISVSPEVRARIFQAAHVLGYVSPRQRKAAEHKTHLVIGVADWRIIRPDRHNVRLSSLSCLVQMMTDQYEVTFVRLTFGEPQKVDGIIALGVFSEKEIDFLRSLSFAILSLRVACIVRPCRRSLSFAGCGILRIGCVSLIHCRSLFLRAPCDSGLRQLRIL